MSDQPDRLVIIPLQVTEDQFERFKEVATATGGTVEQTVEILANLGEQLTRTWPIIDPEAEEARDSFAERRHNPRSGRPRTK